MEMTTPATKVSVAKDSDVLPLPFDRYKTNDSTNTPISAFDMLVATLISKNRDVTFERIEGASHGFYFKDSKGANSHNVSDQLYERLIAWFLSSR
jgi:hypothetical protein